MDRDLAGDLSYSFLVEAVAPMTVRRYIAHLFSFHGEGGGGMIRRTALLGTGLTLAAILGLASLTSARPSPVFARNIKPGGVWTLEMNSGGCETQTFAKHHKWVSDRYSDAGTYKGGRKRLSERWTKGEGDGWSLVGTYQKVSMDYSITLANAGSNFATGQLVKGTVSEWNDFAC
jgi:hypothetical protein